MNGNARTGRHRSAGPAAAAIAAAALVFVLSGCSGQPKAQTAGQTTAAQTAMPETAAQTQTPQGQTSAAESTEPPSKTEKQEAQVPETGTQEVQAPETGTQETKAPPDWVIWKTGSAEADLDRDGTAETLTLEEKRFTARRGGTLLFETPEEWQTADLLHADIDRDGTEEVLLLVWKEGSYGDFRPFWVKENDTEISEHIFIYKCDPDRLRPVWMSSDLGLPVREWTADSEGRLHLTTPEGAERTAVWEGWGLKYAEEAVTLLAVGDNLAHPSVCEAARAPGTWDFDFSPVYDKVRKRISSYDIAAVNQETILVSSPADLSGFPRFGTPESMGDALADAGFDVVLGATNHCMDKGPDRIRSTVSFWREKHPEVTLLGLHDAEEEQEKVPVIEKNGIRIAMLNFTCGLNGFGLPADAPYLADVLPGPELPGGGAEAVPRDAGGSRFTEMIRRAEAEADVTLCFLHIGTEYASEPDEFQRETVRCAVDAGADAVICTHPHVVQRCERIRTPAGSTGAVFWSLGNFMSNQTDPRTVLGGAAELGIGKDGIVSFRMLPTVCHFGKGGTQVYFLSDYTDSLAAEHFLSRAGQPLTVRGLREQWETQTGPR